MRVGIGLQFNFISILKQVFQLLFGIAKHLVGYEEVAVLAGSRHQAGSCHHRGGGLPILCSAEHRLQLDSVLVLLYRDFGLPGATAATYHCVKYFMFFNKLIS